MKCPNCNKTGLYHSFTRTRKKDHAICVYNVCRQYGCGYSKLVSATLPTGVRVDKKKQLLFDFA